MSRVRRPGPAQCHLIRINVREAGASGFGDIRLAMKALDALAAIDELVVFR